MNEEQKYHQEVAEYFGVEAYRGHGGYGDTKGKLTKVFTEPEFKEKCKKANIPFTIRLWNQYVDYAWDQAMIEMGLTNLTPSSTMN